MKSKIILIFIMLISCSSDLPLEPELNIDLEAKGKETIPLDDDQKSLMNGVYEVIEGNDIFDDEVVGKWVENRWCLYAKHDVVFSINAGGFVPDSKDSISLSGYVRIVRSGAGSLLNLTISQDEGAENLKNNTLPEKLIMRSVGKNGKNIVLQWDRELYNKKELIILAHRCGGRNSERLGVSENSLEMIKLAQYLGATGIELDVKITRDGEIIVFHDDTFSPRTVMGAYLLGNVKNFDLSQIQTFGRLINGERIPTLEEALDTVIDKTTLSYVWIDLKDPDILKEVIHIQYDAINYLKNKNRLVTILLGIPTQELMDDFDRVQSPYVDLVSVLVEFDKQIALGSRNTNVLVWAPRWTNNISASDIESVHDAGNKDKKVFIWALDYYDYIHKYLYENQYKGIDGILSNYPSLIAGMHYSRK